MTLDRPSNIDLFNDIAAEVFRELYERFPVASEVDELRIRSKVFEGLAVPDGDAEELVEETIKWLVLSGYVHQDEQGYMVLTLKGLEVLKSTPKAVSEPLGEQLRTAGARGAKHIARGIVDQILAAGFDYMTGG